MLLRNVDVCQVNYSESHQEDGNPSHSSREVTTSHWINKIFVCSYNYVPQRRPWRFYLTDCEPV